MGGSNVETLFPFGRMRMDEQWCATDCRASSYEEGLVSGLP
jgi:hypothetical protein